MRARRRVRCGRRFKPLLKALGYVFFLRGRRLWSEMGCGVGCRAALLLPGGLHEGVLHAHVRLVRPGRGRVGPGPGFRPEMLEEVVGQRVQMV